MNKELIEEAIPVDRGYFKTFFQLYLRPEKVILDENTFSRPLKYATITIAIPLFLSWLVANMYAGDYTDWAAPKRLREINESYQSFRENFDSILYLITALPVIMGLNYFLFKASRQRSFRIATFLSAQLIFTIVFIYLVFQVAEVNTEVDLSTGLTIVLLFGLAYYVYFNLRLFGKNFRIVLKSFLGILFIYVYHFYFSGPLIKYLFHKIRNNHSILFLAEANQSPIFERPIRDFTSIRAIRHNQDGLELIGQIDKSLRVYRRLTPEGAVVEEQTLNFNAYDILNINNKSLFLGYEYNSENIILGNATTSWRYSIGKTMDITGTCSINKKGENLIIICGDNEVNGSTLPRLIIIQVDDSLTSFKIRKDSVFTLKDHTFNSVTANDSAIYVTQLVTPNFETSQIAIHSLDLNSLKSNWQTVIFTKSTKYSPYHYVKIKLDDKGALYNAYTIPNDTNSAVVVNRVDAKTGRLVYSKKIKIDADFIAYQSLATTDDAIVLGILVENYFSENPFIGKYTMGGIFTIDKEKGNLINTKLFGGKHFESTNTFYSVVARGDTLSVVNYKTFELFEGAYKSRKFEVLKFLR